MKTLTEFLKRWQATIYLVVAFSLCLAGLAFALKMTNDARIAAEQRASVAEAVSASQQETIDAYKAGLAAYEREQRQIREEVKAVGRSLATETIDRDAEALNVDPADLFNSRYADLNGMFYDATSGPGETAASSAGADSSAEH